MAGWGLREAGRAQTPRRQGLLLSWRSLSPPAAPLPNGVPTQPWTQHFNVLSAPASIMPPSLDCGQLPVRVCLRVDPRPNWPQTSTLLERLQLMLAIIGTPSIHLRTRPHTDRRAWRRYPSVAAIVLPHWDDLVSLQLAAHVAHGAFVFPPFLFPPIRSSSSNCGECPLPIR